MIHTKYSNYTDEEIVKEACVSGNPFVQELSKRLADKIDSIYRYNRDQDEIDQEIAEALKCPKHSNYALKIKEIVSISESYLNDIGELQEEVKCLYEDNNNLTKRLDCLNEQIDELNDKIYKIQR